MEREVWLDCRDLSPAEAKAWAGALNTPGQGFRFTGILTNKELDTEVPLAQETPTEIATAQLRLQKITIRDAASQAQAITCKQPILASTENWQIIPLENLLASRLAPTWAYAKNPEQVSLLCNVLDVGVAGIVLRPESPPEPLLASLRAAAKPTRQALENRQWSSVTEIRHFGTGDRVCIDLDYAMSAGEGAWIGATGGAFCLVLAETAASRYIEPRPFRVNAGAISQYILSGDATAYLSELRAGTKIATDGGHEAHVIRTKIERRPHTLIRWRDGYAVLQTAETVRLLGPAGPKAITDLQVGDQVATRTTTAARHTGKAITAKVKEA